MADDGPVIELRGVRFAYEPGRPVLAGIDFTLRPGQRVGLVGANGSGKTTLLHVVMGLAFPDEGEVRLLGKRCATEADFGRVRHRIGMLFQDPDDQLFCPTVAEDVGFGPFNMGKDRDEVAAIVEMTLDMLGLSGYADRITYHLSAGEKRLVSLAAVLALGPAALLLDEPETALDEESEKRVVEVLNRLDLPMVVISHNPEFLEQTTNSRVILRDGVLHG